MRFEKIKQTVEEKKMWLLEHIVLGNNECYSNFPSCDIVLFYSQLRLQVFVVVFFKIKKVQLYLLGISIFSIFAMPYTCFDLTSLMSFDRMKADHFLRVECFKGTHPFCEEFLSLSSTSIFFALDNRIKMNTL